MKRIDLLITENTPLTADILKVIPPNTVFFKGYNDTMRYFVYKDFGTGWLIVYNKRSNSHFYSIREDNLFHLKKDISKVIPCKKSALLMYNRSKIDISKFASISNLN